jgi:peptidoglycan/LPS O-acetylase OafA/YrhL
VIRYKAAGQTRAFVVRFRHGLPEQWYDCPESNKVLPVQVATTWRGILPTASPAANRAHAAVPTGSEDRSFRPDIEGLRALAVGLVVLDHAGIALFSGGYVGVDVFFVLSGFLITGILFAELDRTGTISLPRFYARRARRLLPAGALVLIATVIAMYELVGGTRAERTAVDARWTALFAANVRFIRLGTDYMNSTLPPSPLQHFWSLAVEEQFYLVWPLLMITIGILCRNRSVRRWSTVALAVIVVVSLAFSAWQTPRNGTLAYFSPFTRAWELGLGGLLALAAPSLKRAPGVVGQVAGPVGVAMIGYAAVAFGPETVFPGLAALVPVIGACLVVAAGGIRGGFPVDRFISQRPFLFVGRLSYSIYLWHWPLLIVGAAWAGHELNLAQNAGLIVFSVVLSWLTFTLLERPVRDSGRLKARHPSVSLVMGSAFTAAIILVASVVIALIPNMPTIDAAEAGTIILPSEAQVESAVAEWTQETEWPPQPKRIANLAMAKGCRISRAATVGPLCRFGDPNASRVAVVYGDSHAEMWMPALDVIARSEGWQIVQVTKPGCQVPDFRRYSPTMKREYTECDTFRDWAIGQITSLKPDLIIISSSSKDVEEWTDDGPSGENMDQIWGDGLAKVIQEIQPSTSRVVVIGDMAYPVEPGIDCLTAHPDDIEECSAAVTDAVPAEMNAVEKQVAAANGADYIDVIPWFCTDSTCPAVVGGLTTHRDDFHINENYAVWLSNVLGQAIGLISPEHPLTAIRVPTQS